MGAVDAIHTSIVSHRQLHPLRRNHPQPGIGKATVFFQTLWHSCRPVALPSLLLVACTPKLSCGTPISENMYGTMHCGASKESRRKKKQRERYPSCWRHSTLVAAIISLPVILPDAQSIATESRRNHPQSSGCRRCQRSGNPTTLDSQKKTLAHWKMHEMQLWRRPSVTLHLITLVQSKPDFFSSWPKSGATACTPLHRPT